MRKLDAFVKNQRRFHAAVAEKGSTLHERQAASVFGHVGLHPFWSRWIPAERSHSRKDG
ncbi:hypothetical protein D3C72_2052360 [compost metagenome]